MQAFLEACRRIMLENGLVPDALVTDGSLCRCPTEGKPQGKDGAYIIHTDEPLSLWWCNHRTGQSDTYTAKGEKTFTAEERKAFAQRMEPEKAQRQADTRERQREAAEKAQSIWDNAPPAADTHPYLVRKRVPSLGLKLGRNNTLIVPVTGETGHIMSLQFIPTEEGGNKPFLSGGKTKGGFFAIPAKNGLNDGTLCIGEGYATMASVYLATGYACLIAFGANNLEAVARMARAKYPDRKIILCADNDRKPDTDANPGIEAATVTKSLLVICPLVDGEKADFNDLHVQKGLEAVRSCIENAKQPEQCLEVHGITVNEATEQPPRSKAEARERQAAKGDDKAYFECRESGLWFCTPKDDGELAETWLCSPLEVLGKTRDASSNAWGLYLQWKDPDNKLHSWAMPTALLVGRDVSEAFRRLADGGLQIAPSAKAKNLLAQYLITNKTQARILCIDRIGWHEGAFVLPDATIQPEEA